MKSRHISKVIDVFQRTCSCLLDMKKNPGSQHFSYFTLSNLLTQTCLHFCTQGSSSSENAKCTFIIYYNICFPIFAHICNAKPAEGALTRILTVLHSLCFSSHFLFGTFISMLAFWDHAKYYCLTECLSCIQFAFLCMILPVYLTTIILDLPFCCDCLTNLMFVFGPFACLLVSVYWINPVLVNGSDCYTGIDPLPEFTFLPVESLLKLLLMDSNSASAASLQHTVF